MPTKPPFCCEANCECIMNRGLDGLAKGASVSCIGKMKDRSIARFGYGETEHDANEFYSCTYTPMKGWIKFMVNWDDLFADLQLIAAAGRAGGHLRCDECDHPHISVGVIGDDGRRRCTACAVRHEKAG